MLHTCRKSINVVISIVEQHTIAKHRIVSAFTSYEL